MKKFVMLDLDGTTADTEELILSSYEHTLRTHGLPPIQREYLLKLAGLPLREVYNALSLDVDALIATHRDFQNQNMHLVKPFPMVFETIAALRQRNMRVAIVTNRSRKSTEEILEVVGISHLFDFIVTVDDVTNPKPHPEGINRARSSSGFRNYESCMVGDTAHDIEAGKRGHVMTVGVTYGHQGKTLHTAEPEFLIDSFDKLLPIVLR